MSAPMTRPYRPATLPRDLEGFDLYMVGVACRRERAIYEPEGEEPVEVTLVAWMPHRGKARTRTWTARIEFLNGERLTVSCRHVVPKVPYPEG